MEKIDGKILYTVKDAAMAWGTSVQTAYKRIQRLRQDSGQTDGHITNVQNKVYVDSAIVAMFSTRTAGQDKSAKIPEMSAMSEAPPDTPTDALAKVLREEVGLLREQLAAKDEEITRLHEELDRLHSDVEEIHKLLDQAHQLAAMSQTKELETPQKRWWRRRRLTY